jgi:hypothetical protein
MKDEWAEASIPMAILAHSARDGQEARSINLGFRFQVHFVGRIRLDWVGFTWINAAVGADGRSGDGNGVM